MKNLTLIFILLFSIKNLNAQNAILKTQQDTTDLIVYLSGMETLDQMYRGQISDMWKSKNVDTLERNRIGKLQRDLDSTNFAKLDSLANVYGMENISIIGGNAVFIIVQHGSLALQQKYLPIFKKVHKEKGKISGQNLALLEDRLLVRTLQKQLYGTQICKNAETNEQFVCALEDPENVQIRRLEMGIKFTLSEYCGYFNFKWNIEEYKKRLPEYEAIQKKQGKW
jgi:cell division protein FtsL